MVLFSFSLVQSNFLLGHQRKCIFHAGALSTLTFLRSAHECQIPRIPSVVRFPTVELASELTETPSLATPPVLASEEPLLDTDVHLTPTVYLDTEVSTS